MYIYVQSQEIHIKPTNKNVIRMVWSYVFMDIKKGILKKLNRQIQDEVMKSNRNIELFQSAF